MKHFRFYSSSASNDFWDEIGEAIALSFEDCGASVERCVDKFPDRLENGVCNIAVGGQEYFNLLLKTPALIHEVAPRMVALTGEQPGSPWFAPNLPNLRLCQECWDLTDTGDKALRHEGVRSKHIQLGYSRLFEASSTPTEKDIDVFFLASLTHSRSKRIAEYGLTRFDVRNHFQLVDIDLVNIGYEKNKASSLYLPRETRNTIASRSKCVLNYHGYFIEFFEWHRALIALSNQSLFVTDTVPDPACLVPGIHYFSGSSQVVNHIVDFFLSHPSLRDELALKAYEHVKTFMNMAQLSHQFLSNEVIEIPPADRGTELAREVQLKLKEFVAKEKRKFFPVAFSASCNRGPGETRGPLVSKTETLVKRHHFIENLRCEDALRPSSSHIAHRYQNEHASGLPAPHLSVIISLHNYEHTICSALDSLLFSFANPELLEIIVVDDASSDDSYETAVDWIRFFSGRGVVLKKRINTGFIASRNIGIEIAQSNYVAILDADNAFLPCGLQRLLDRAIQEDADAAYGIIICIDEMGHPSGLLSAQSWDLRRLVHSPYIDAMAVFKKSTLDSVGRYDEKMFRSGWFGWEDYELWLRLADNSSRVVFLPEFVAMYRSHSSSMINATNLFQESLALYLREKYPDLVRRFGGGTCVMGSAQF